MKKDKYGDIKLVEDALNRYDGIPTARIIKKGLAGKIRPELIDAILNYFEVKGYTITGSKGITWIHNDSPKLLRMIRKAKKREMNRPELRL